MAAQDVIFFEQLVGYIRNVSKAFSAVVDIALDGSSTGSTSAGHWSNEAQKRNLFVKIAQSMRQAASDLHTTVEDGARNLQLLAHRTTIGIGNETLMMYLKRSCPKLFLQAEEIVTVCIEFMQASGGHTHQDLYERLSEETLLATQLLQRADFLRVALGQTNSCLIIDEAPEEEEYTAYPPSTKRSDSVDVMAEFDAACEALNARSPSLASASSLRGSSEDLATRVSDVGEAFAQASVAANAGRRPGSFVPANQRGRGRGRGRGGLLRSNTLMGGARFAPPFQRSPPQEVLNLADKIAELVPKLKSITEASCGDDLDSCTTATTFVPTAKSLLSFVNRCGDLLASVSPPEFQDGFMTIGLRCIHQNKELFLQQHSDGDRKELEKASKALLDAVECLRNNKALSPSMLPSAPRASTIPSQRARSDVNLRPTMPGQIDVRDTRTNTFALAERPSSGQRKGILGCRPSEMAPASPSPQQPRKLTRAETRERAIDEVHASEKTYFKSLQQIIWIYKKPLSENARSSDPVISEKEVSLLFSNIESMFQFNKNLLKELNRSRAEEEYSLGDVFLSVAPMMKLYSTYINNFDQSSETLLQCETRPAFNALVGEYNTLAGVDMKLRAFLIQPVQRLPRYEMLIGAVLKYTDEDHPEYASLALAKDSIKAINDEVNESKRRAEAREAVYQVQVKMGDKPSDLVILQPTRAMKLEGSVMRMNPKTRKPEKRYVHIFSDLVIISRLKGSTAAQGFKYRDHFPIDRTLTASVDKMQATVTIMTKPNVAPAGCLAPGVPSTGEPVSETWIFNADVEAEQWAKTIKDLIASEDYRRTFSGLQ